MTTTTPRDESSTPWAIDVEVPSLIPFEPVGALLVVRNRLRDELGKLMARPGELLHGQVSGPALSRTDLDNALLYNIGGRQAAATKNGVVLGRRIGPGPNVHYRYRMAESAGLATPPGPALAFLHAVPLGNRPGRWIDVWRVVRASDRLEVVGTQPDGDIHLHLRVGAPGYGGSTTPEFVKALIDGVLVALHHDPTVLPADDVVVRLASRAGMAPVDVARLLVSDESAALGPAPRLLCTWRDSIQCRPADHRVASLRIELDREATQWSLTGWV